MPNLSLALFARGYRIIAIDLDHLLNNLEVAFNCESVVQYGISDCLCGRVFLSSALYAVTKYGLPPQTSDGLKNSEGGLFILSSHGRAVGKSELHEVVSLCAKLCDFVILDTAAGMHPLIEYAAAVCTDAVIITTPHLTAIKDADKTAGFLSRYGRLQTSLAVNRVRADHLANAKCPAHNEISALIRVPLSAALPEDDEINLRGTVSPFLKSQSQEAYFLFSKFITEGEGKIFSFAPQKRGLFARYAN